jgi:hypothetical protein
MKITPSMLSAQCVGLSNLVSAHDELLIALSLEKSVLLVMMFNQGLEGNKSAKSFQAKAFISYMFGSSISNEDINKIYQSFGRLNHLCVRRLQPLMITQLSSCNDTLRTCYNIKLSLTTICARVARVDAGVWTITRKLSGEVARTLTHALL